MEKLVDGSLNDSQVDNQLLAVLLDNMQEGITVCDSEGICRVVSASVYELTGYCPDELVGNAWTAYCHTDDVAQFNAFFNEKKADCLERGLHIEYRYQCKDGKYKWFETKLARFSVGEDALSSGVAMLSRDITIRKTALQQKVENYLFWAFDKLKAGVWSERPDAICSSVLRPWWGLLGYRDDEIDHTWKGWLTLCHPLDRERLGDALKDCAISGGQHELYIKYRIRHKTGVYHNFLASGRKNVDWQTCDETLSWSGIVVDITELEMLETAQHKRETQLKDFVRAFCDISAIIDEDGRCVEIVAKHEQLPFVDLVRGESLYNGIFAEKADLLGRHIRQAINEYKLEMCSFEYKDKGQQNLVRMKFSPMNYKVEGRRTVAVILSWTNEAGNTEQLMDFALLFKRRSRFMDDVLRGGRTINLDKADRTEADRLDLPIAFFCCIVSLKDASKKDELEWFYKRQLMIMQYLSEIRGLFVWEYQGNIGILIDVHMISVGEDAQFAASIIEMISAYDPGVIANAGVSQRQTGFAKIGKGCEQAMKALTMAEQQSNPCVLSFSDLGIYQILANFNPGEETQEYIQGVLGNLLEYDRVHGMNLVNVLDTILRSANLKVAAEQLFFHYNTIVRKQKQIETILGYSLENPEVRLNLSVAIKLFVLMQKKQQESWGGKGTTI